MRRMTGIRKDGLEYQILENPHSNSPCPITAVVERADGRGNTEIELKGCQTIMEAKFWISRQ